MTNSIVVKNIKCGGCANSIKKKLNDIPGVSKVDIFIETGEVTWTADDDNSDQIKRTLSSMGYPEGDSNILQTAKSYVSCAIGKMSNSSPTDN